MYPISLARLDGTYKILPYQLVLPFPECKYQLFRE